MGGLQNRELSKYNIIKGRDSWENFDIQVYCSCENCSNLHTLIKVENMNYY
jgi:hypothetical protein